MTALQTERGLLFGHLFRTGVAQLHTLGDWSGAVEGLVKAYEDAIVQDEGRKNFEPLAAWGREFFAAEGA
jgi:hypothetical protein